MSKNLKSLILAWLAASCVLASAGSAFGFTNALRFTGRLTEAAGHAPFTGTAALSFTFYANETDTTPLPIGPLLMSHEVTDGVFDVEVALTPEELHQLFGAGGTVYVETAETGTGLVFPRQMYNAMPYAYSMPIDGRTIMYDQDGRMSLGDDGVQIPTSATTAIELKTDPATPHATTYTLPAAPVGELYLRTDANGNLEWADPASTIDEADIPDATIDGSKIVNGSLTSDELADDSIQSAQLANLSVTNPKISADAVTGPAIASGAVTNADLADDSVDASKIVDGSVGASEIVDTSLSFSKIATTGCTSPQVLMKVAGAWACGTEGMPQPAPVDAIIYWNGASCPSGFTELAASRGRYIVGLNGGGTLGATVGTALTNLENRAVGQHNHTAIDSGHTHSITDPGHSHSYLRSSGQAHVGWNANDGSGAPQYNYTGNSNVGMSAAATGITINNGTANLLAGDAGTVAGTNAPYIQLLICEKDP